MAITQTITSGVGSLEYVYVTGDGRENLSGNFKYSADLVVDSEDPLIDEINKFWKKFKPDNYKRKPKSLGYRPHKIRTEEETKMVNIFGKKQEKFLLISEQIQLTLVVV